MYTNIYILTTKFYVSAHLWPASSNNPTLGDSLAFMCFTNVHPPKGFTHRLLSKRRPPSRQWHQQQAYLIGGCLALGVSPWSIAGSHFWEGQMWATSEPMTKDAATSSSNPLCSIFTQRLWHKNFPQVWNYRGNYSGSAFKYEADSNVKGLSSVLHIKITSTKAIVSVLP